MPELAPPAVAAGRLRRQAQPSITTGELVVRPWRSEDVDAVVEAYRDPDIQRWHVRTMTPGEAGAWIASWADRWTAETAASWAVTRSDQVVGRTGFNAIDLAAGRAAAAYWTMPDARGSGVAVRALRAVSDWMLTEGGLHRLQLVHSAENVASCRVAVASGYLAEGTMRGYGLHHDGWHDMHLHALLADEHRCETMAR